MNKDLEFKLARYAYGSVIDFCRAMGISQSTFWNYVNHPERLSKETYAAIRRKMSQIQRNVKEELK